MKYQCEVCGKIHDFMGQAKRCEDNHKITGPCTSHWWEYFTYDDGDLHKICKVCEHEEGVHLDQSDLADLWERKAKEKEGHVSGN